MNPCSLGKPHGDLILSGVSIGASPNHNILGMKFDSRPTFEDHVRGIVSRISQRICILRLVDFVFVDTSVLFRCYCAFGLPILEYCSPVFCWMSSSAARMPSVFGGRRLCPDQTFLSLCHRRHVAALCMLYLVNSYSNHCLLSEISSASVRVWHTRAVTAAHPLEFEVSRCRTCQIARCFLPAKTCVWNELPYTVFNLFVFFPTWVCPTGFNNNIIGNEELVNKFTNTCA